MDLNPSGEQYELVCGGRNAIVTEVGATLRSYSVGGVDVLDGFDGSESSSGGRGQLLIPWPNRLRDGTYEWAGEQQQLPLSEPERHNAIHGLVRWQAWTLLESAAERVSLGLRLYPRPGYPFTLVLRIDYELGDAGLRVRARAENAGGEACPYGIGFHPYLTVGERIDSARLRIAAALALAVDERMLPVGWERVEGTRYDFREPRAIGETVLDTCYGELARDADGRARVTLSDGDREATLWMGDGIEYVMAFSGDTLAAERRRRGLGVEPMSCAPDAFRNGEGLVTLEPGASHTVEWGIEP
jgi:aldose 1-epimerase